MKRERKTESPLQINLEFLQGERPLSSDLRITLCGLRLCPLGSWLHFLSHPPFSKKVAYARS